MNPINPAAIATWDRPSGFRPKPRSTRYTAVVPIAITTMPATRTVINAR